MEHVVLLDEDGHATGIAPKATVHHAETPLHLAFSVYVFHEDRLLVSRRARDKATFPGVWTNSACGHPAPDEPLADAVHRRVRQELGLALEDLRLVLPDFRYTAEMDGVRENEMCPVWTARAGGIPDPDPQEVDDLRWEDWGTFSAEVLTGARSVSTWCRAQVPALVALGPDPRSWPDADPLRLPPAARVA